MRPREPAAHKGDSGYLLLVAGNRGMAGAAVLAARAAYRAGAGIVRVVGHPDNREIIQGSVPGAVFESWSDGLEDALGWAHALALGPGLGRGHDRRDLVARLLDGRSAQPAVVDADALNAFEEEPEVLAGLLSDRDVITPHPGEMARLLRCAVPDIVSDPLGAVASAVEEFGCTVVLKGAPTLIGDTTGPVRVASTGGPALAVGGTGDVLAGAIGAYLAGGYPASDAASVASLLTGIAACASGEAVGLVAEDIPDRIPEARASVEQLGPLPCDAVLYASNPVRPST